MIHFPIHSLETAPEESRQHLEALRNAFGFVPNIACAMATSPILIGSLTALFGRVHSGSFSEGEIQIVLLTNAVTNRSQWPVAFHSYLALEQGIEPDDVQALRVGGLPRDRKLAALSALAKALILQRGHLTEHEKSEFLSAGYGTDRLLEVIAIVAASTITNYTANVTLPMLEEKFATNAWHPAS
ncbi:carboxymuconolactone decarboxylase family protein [Rhizobium sp. XQZ8]|uniref:carboxymuconolactone decarboxylase family protein n=1 Tax=Rhizobium populisoli TaxID=2859785 RepID=UPI001CA53B72|nr:carboxymuconolactone decarboxylase family protein [Rhizobium populisoli]MBW6425626.1 carboxymuconolactone decarboxylase family protein [Rhizobium populisoli]